MTSFKPTIIGAKQQSAGPTRIGTLPPPQMPAGKPTVSALQGVSRKPLDVSLGELQQRFPRENDEVLAKVSVCLSATICDAGNWLAFGEEIQRKVSKLVSGRLASSQHDALRTAPRHLARLQELLLALADSFAGGLLRPANPLRTWEAARPEIGQLEEALALCLPDIVAVQAETAGRMEDARRMKCHARAAALAAEVLVERLGGRNGDILTGRQASLLASEALLDELLVQLELDESRQAFLIEQIRDGVLLRLTSLANTLAGLPAKTNDTERFLLQEKLGELVRFFERKR